MSSSIRCKIAALGAALVGAFVGCTKSTVDLYLRPCEDGQCAAGYVCNRQNGDICVLPAGVPSPSAVSDGDPCTSYGSFIPCEDGAAGCERGCRTCQPDNTWGSCSTTGCKIGSVTGCATCEDDCTKKVENATPICRQKGNLFTCDYSGNCAAGFRDADGGRGNGCECAPECTGRCAGSDGCGGTCPNNCTSPESCGGSGVTNVCGCTPQCSGKCAGSDGCFGTCPDTCVAPDSCGGGGFSEYCGCTPDCTGKCDGPNGCYGTCPSVACTPPDTCSGGPTPHVCGCTPQCGGKCGGSDACGATCPDNCVGLETCGGLGGTPDVCGWWWSCAYAQRYQLTIQNFGAAIPAGYAVSFTFDHGQWFSGGISLASGNDVRVVYWNGASWTEIDRVLDPDTSWGATNTTVWFKLQVALAPNTTSTDYFVYVDNAAPPAPPANEASVFRFADFFNRANNATVGNGWNVNEQNSTNIDIASNALYFATTTDRVNRPFAAHTFQALTKLVFRFGFDWTRTSTDNNYMLWMQLGASAQMTVPSTSNSPVVYPSAGIGPDLMWGGFWDGTTQYQNEFFPFNGAGFIVDGSLQLSGARRVRIVVDATQPPNGKYDLFVSDPAYTSTATVLGNDFANNTGALDTIRFVSHSMDSTSNRIAGRTFDYVLIREFIKPEPKVDMSATGESSGCP